MDAFLIPLLRGAVLVFSVFGVGSLALRLLKLRTLPWYWHLAFTAILGQGTVNLLVQGLLLSGASSTSRLRILGWVLMLAGLAGFLLTVSLSAIRSTLAQFRNHRLLKTVLVAAWLTNLVVALAPSSKIDELFYHMLVPKRIAAEGSLNYYRLPLEAAIVPQMQYQMSLSPAYALGAPESGNVLSLAYSVVLGLFIIGFIRDLTGNESIALLGGLGSCVGAYQTVWHTTEGPAAIGELALVVALCGLLWPEALKARVKTVQVGFLIVTAASLAASTKISLWPLATIVSLWAVWKTYRDAQGAERSVLSAGLALLPWTVMHLPLMFWTYHESGSFWGPVMANVLRPSLFPAALLKGLEGMRKANQVGLLSNVRFAAVELSPLIFLGVGLTLWAAFRKCREAALIIGLVLFQGVLILWLLPYDFRFFGGLLYLPLINAAVQLTSSEKDPTRLASLSPLANRVVSLRNWIVIVAAVPWLLFQMYYARPFAKATFGIMERNEFREHFVALTRDYEILNRILPPDAVLYVASGRVSLFDAPRPVVLTPLDLQQTRFIFRLTVKDTAPTERFGAGSILNCEKIVYENDHAVVETHRLPGGLPKVGTVIVRSCKIDVAEPGS